MRLRAWIGVGVLVGLGVGAPSLASAGVRPEAYAEVIRLVDSLYLHPDRVDAASLLRAAARGLAERVDWLMVEADGPTVYLHHGDGTHLGSLSVASTHTLPEALLALEDLVYASGYDLGGVDVRLAVLQGLGDALDRYSTVLAGDGLERFDTRLKGTLVGIGVTFRSRGDALVVRELVADGPAARAGLRVGDVVVRIDGLSTVNLTEREASRRIGGDAGTQVGLTVRRDGKLTELFVTRAEVVIPNVEHRGLPGEVGYVRILHFSQRTDENLRLALDDLARTGAMARGLVIDLRGNTGGSMKDSARSADEFVHAGVLLRTAGADGQRVRNLQSRMDAVSVGNEPDVPVVVIMDGRTASGSEIMAGALRYLDRAALIGGRSFGKGTVQKVYTVDPAAKLKLTVARYLLAGDRHITDDGLAPDLPVDDIVLDQDGVRVWRADRGAPEGATTAPVAVVIERAGWRGQRPSADDARVELARRAALGASGPSRGSLLPSLSLAADELREEHAARLADALAARGIDWSVSAAPESGFEPPRVDVALTVAPDPGMPGAWRVHVAAHNREPVALERVWIELDSSTSSIWRGIAFPLGRIAPGAKADGAFRLWPAVGLERREDEVVARVSAASRSDWYADPVALAVEGPAEPEVGLTVRFVEAGAETRAEVTVRNVGGSPVGPLEVAFGHPGDLDVELVSSSVAVPEIAPRAAAQVALGLRVGPTAPARLPLGLVVTRDGAGSALVEWPIDLPRDGEAVVLRAPRVEVLTAERSAPVGAWTLPLRIVDDVRLDHVVVYVNGDKVAWAPGGRATLDFAPTVRLEAGQNRIVIVAHDEQGLSRRRSLDVRGEVPFTVDAGEDAGPTRP